MCPEKTKPTYFPAFRALPPYKAKQTPEERRRENWDNKTKQIISEAQEDGLTQREQNMIAARVSAEQSRRNKYNWDTLDALRDEQRALEKKAGVSFGKTPGSLVTGPGSAGPTTDQQRAAARAQVVAANKELSYKEQVEKYGAGGTMESETERRYMGHTKHKAGSTHGGGREHWHRPRPNKDRTPHDE